MEKEQSDLGELITVPSVTKDGAQVKLEANIGRPEEVEIALKFGAEGSGFLERNFFSWTETRCRQKKNNLRPIRRH